MKIKWKHKQNIGRVFRLSKDIVRMLKLGATFDLTPAYRIYYKNDKEIKRELLHISLRLHKKNERNILY